MQQKVRVFAYRFSIAHRNPDLTWLNAHPQILMDEPSSSTTGGTAAAADNINGSHINFIYRIIRAKRHRGHDRQSRRRVRSTFMEHFWAIRDMRYTRLNPKLGKAKAATDRSSGAASERLTVRCRSLDSLSDGHIPLQCLDAHLLLSATERRNRPPRVSPGESASSSSLELEWEHEAGASQRDTWIGTADDSEEATTAGSGESSASSSSSSSLSSARKARASMSVRRRPAVPSMRSAVIAIAQRDTPASSATPPAAATAATAAAAAIANANLSRASSWSHRSTPDSLEWDVDDARPNNAASTMMPPSFTLRSSEEDLLDADTMELLQEIEWLKNRALSETGATFREPSMLLETES